MAPNHLVKNIEIDKSAKATPDMDDFGHHENGWLAGSHFYDLGKTWFKCVHWYHAQFLNSKNSNSGEPIFLNLINYVEIGTKSPQMTVFGQK